MSRTGLFDKSRFDRALIPLTAIVMSFLIGIVIMLATGVNPIGAFKAMIRAVAGIHIDNIGRGTVFNPRFVGEFFVTAMPIILTGLSVAFAFRTGLFNIGVEGQMMMGSLLAAVAAVTIKAPGIIHLPLVILASAVGGAFWAAIPGVLKAKFRVHEVVVTIMLNYAALHITNYFLKLLPGSSTIKTVAFPSSALLHSSFFQTLTNNSRFHWGFTLVIASLIASHYIIEKTVLGYELRAVGFNREAARYGGINVEKSLVLSMVISGVFAGLAGAMLTVGTFNRGRVLSFFEGYGFDGIAVALLGGGTSIGCLWGGLLFGGLKAAGPQMQASGIPREIGMIISSLMVLFVAMQYGVEDLLNRIRYRKKETLV